MVIETPENSLTERECQVLVLCAFGCEQQDIADALFVTESTVNTFMARIRAKLGARNTAHAVVIAHWRGYLSDRDLSQCEEYRTPMELALAGEYRK